MLSLQLITSSPEDAEHLAMDASQVSERIEIMRDQESTTYRCYDYLAENENLCKTAARPVDQDCRTKMCDWCYQVVDFCKFRRETVTIGMNYLDRYLSTPVGRSALADRKVFQLAAMTTLYMAIKLNEPMEMETSLLADLSRGCYTDVEVAAMERTILLALQWRVSGPTTLSFVQHFMALFPSSVHPSVGTAIYDYARYQTELALPEYSFVTENMSSVALAAILNAMEGVDRKLLPLKSQGAFLRAVEKASGIMREEVIDIQESLSNIMLDIVSEDLTSASASEWSKSSDYTEVESDLTSDPSRGRRGSSPVSVARSSSSSKRLYA